MFRFGQTRLDDDTMKGASRFRPIGNIHSDIFSSSNPRHPPPTSAKRLPPLIFGIQRIAGIFILAALFMAGGCQSFCGTGVRSDSPKPLLLATNGHNGKKGEFEVWMISREAYSHAERSFIQAPEKINRSYWEKPLDMVTSSMIVAASHGITKKVWTIGPWTIRVHDAIHNDSRCAHLEVMIKGYESHPFILKIMKDMDGPSANVFYLEIRHPEGNLYGELDAAIDSETTRLRRLSFDWF